MTPHDELTLYKNDRAAWAEYVAPRWEVLLQAADDAEKERLWQLASDELRTALRRLKRPLAPEPTP